MSSEKFKELSLDGDKQDVLIKVIIKSVMWIRIGLDIDPDPDKALDPILKFQKMSYEVN